MRVLLFLQMEKKSARGTKSLYLDIFRCTFKIQIGFYEKYYLRGKINAYVGGSALFAGGTPHEVDEQEGQQRHRGQCRQVLHPRHLQRLQRTPNINKSYLFNRTINHSVATIKSNFTDFSWLNDFLLQALSRFNLFENK